MLTDRNAARASGHRFYLATRPCRNGHTAPRYVSTGGCSECLKDWRDTERRATEAASVAAAQGSRLFSYALHPDDLAAALAFCQSLDVQRGRMPQATARDFTPPKAALFAQGGPVELPPMIAAARRLLDTLPDVSAQHDAIRSRIKP